MALYRLGLARVRVSDEGKVVSTEIPDKTYFKIGEVAKIIGVKAYVIRYWESEFPMLRPQKTRSNQRLFQRRDIELLQAIKRLVHDEKFTIEGARLQLKQQRAASQDPADNEPADAPEGAQEPSGSSVTGSRETVRTTSPTPVLRNRRATPPAPEPPPAEAVNLSLFDEPDATPPEEETGPTTRPMRQAHRESVTPVEGHVSVTSAVERWKNRAEAAEARVRTLEQTLAHFETAVEAMLEAPEP